MRSEYQGRIEIMRATALQGLGKNKEAYEAYKRFQQTSFSQTGVGRVHGNGYLVSAQRYKEAADNYRFLDKAMQEQGLEPTLDVIQLYMLPKYRANYEARRGDSARAMGVRILGILDSAITTQKLSASVGRVGYHLPYQRERSRDSPSTGEDVADANGWQSDSAGLDHRLPALLHAPQA